MPLVDATCPFLSLSQTVMAKSKSGIWVVVALVVWLGACGQKGPLYLPDQDPSAAKKQER
jgi:predicted small lipoprotein YifL